MTPIWTYVLLKTFALVVLIKVAKNPMIGLDLSTGGFHMTNVIICIMINFPQILVWSLRPHSIMCLCTNLKSYELSKTEFWAEEVRKFAITL